MKKYFSLASIKSAYNKVFRIFKKNDSLEQAMRKLIERQDFKNSIHSEEKNFFRNFLHVGRMKTNEIMIPRADMVSIPVDITLGDLHQVFVQRGHTRLPVYKDSLDDVIGFVHIKDVIGYLGDSKQKFNLSQIIRQLIYVPRSMDVLDLFAKMRAATVHIAIVLDEHGSTEGLVTVEDIIEEIVGEIKDEHEQAKEEGLVKLKEHVFEVDGRVEIDALEKELGISLTGEDGDYETFGGFVLSYLGRIPEVSEKIIHPKGIEIIITDASKKRLKKARVRVLPKALPDPKHNGKR
jgi:CBS domain containing-hemolysin-like protein